MRFLEILGLWTAVSVPVAVATGFFLAAGGADRGCRPAPLPPK